MGAPSMLRTGYARPGRERIRPSGVVPLPPMPADPMRCRWCLGPNVAIADRFLCQRGCMPADKPLFDCTCQECRRSFQTGEGPSVPICWQCRDREYAAMSRDASAPALNSTGYGADMRKKGASREAAKLAEQER